MKMLKNAGDRPYRGLLGGLNVDKYVESVDRY